MAAFLCAERFYGYDANVNYLGLINMLQTLKNAGLISKAEERRVAARLKVEIGADIVIPV